ncbi:MAG TPA: TetR family transcriptional regulator [Methylibium sp.]|jgi:TetR/AcrR family transcriptional regulator, acrAB operon repressor|nr:TetR family transcriptional regulator [Methylibium sp.]
MPRRTKEDAQITRDRLLDAAELEFQRRGVSRTSLQEIARAAGVTRGAVYWHFSDKADLFNAMMNRVVLPLEQEIKRSDEPGLDDPLAQIRSSFLAALRATVEDPQARRTFEIALHKVEYVDELDRVRLRRVNGLRERVDHVERGFRRVTLAPGVTPRAAALGMHSLVDGLIQNWMLDPGSFDLLQVGARTIDAYLRGLLSAPPPCAAAAPPRRARAPRSPR